MNYPKTRLDAIEEAVHGVTVADPYRWLEDANSDETQQWMSAQDELARRWLAQLPGRDALEKRLRELYYVDAISAPVHRGNRYFHTRTHANKEKAIYYWREGEDGAEQVLLDPNTMSKDGTASIQAVSVSRDGTRVAYQWNANNSDEGDIRVMEVATGQLSAVDTVPHVKWTNMSWSRDGDGFYYTWMPQASERIAESDRLGYAEIRFHRLATDPANDPVIFPATHDPHSFLGAAASRDGHWLLVTVQHGWNASDVYLKDLRKPDSTFEPFVVGKNAIFNVFEWQDTFYVHTNDEAPRYRLFKVNAKQRARADWIEIVPEASDAVLDSVCIVGGKLALHWMKNASSTLEVRSLDGKPERTVQFPLLGTSSGFMGREDEDTAYYSFTSFTRPQQIFKTSMTTGETSLWAEVELPIDPSPYTVEQVWFASKDGTRVSMFLVHKKGLVRDGSTPWLLSGYGGFNVSETPAFRSSFYPWLEAGGGIAVANLRGGGEYGEDWHKAGMLANKQNVFDDFIGAAEHLIRESYTRADKLAIMGGSNGGLLVGAATTQRPELFRAVICQVPLLDMVRYHLFGAGKAWVPEYGSAENPDQFKWLFAYSPYHHVKAGTHYPALLMASADSDDRVDPMHARKMVAALQAANAGAHPILLRIEKHAGHGGADLVKQAVQQSADSYAFLMHELGMKPAAN